jgi:hypothetical protein
MKRIMIIMFVLVCAGCATSGNVDELMKQLNELTEKTKQANESLKNDYKRDLATAQQSLQTDYNNKFDNFKKELDAQKEVHQKDMKEVNVTLIDIQKDFFQNRRLTEDNARRTYIIESLIAATRSTPEERAEGEIVYLKDNDVTTSLGSKHGLKAGDMLAVYKNSSSQEKLATIRIMVTETTQSKGEIVEKSAAIARGNVVRPIK